MILTNTILENLRALIQARKEASSDVEWQDIADFLSAETGCEWKREYLRKGVVIYDLFDQAGWVHSPNLAAETESVVENDTATVVPQTKSTTLNADGSQSSELRAKVSEEDLRDPEFLLRLHGYDPAYFELVSAKASQWSSGADPLYSSKIAVKPKTPELRKDDIEAWFDALDRNFSPAVPKKMDGWGDGDKLLLVPISDLHFNMLASIFNSGNEYNCDLAEEMFFHIIQDVLNETARYDLKRIVFTIGGDQMDADGVGNTTTKGTPQHCDKHYWDACEQIYAMTVKAVDLFAERAPVDVIYVPGNHDKGTGFKLAKYLDAWFRNDDRVTVDYSPRARHYYVFGKTLFVFTHDADVKRLQKLIPDEARDLWASVDYTEVFLQHLHSEALLSQENSMRIERLPSPVARSVWTDEMGYRAIRQCKSFVYDEEYGRKAVIHTVVPN